ncbi:universal stress protein [Jannaschia seohaensis]|uniref:Universal stress protein F n=1 Tax=Jannaschia seohaensis TaxID=475081 RepID=A0A2Y9C5L8_9RHOB|nr:universal stress protein [Jannaschia seohaensis]PWJ21133.1 universal stress protein F [Jannaschia seohaensis]SSA41543.1 universal stress protein F [Jannaschia seohaensis]
MFENILLPVDPAHDESWKQAVPLALRCAAGEGKIHLLGIVHDVGGPLVANYLPENYVQHAMEHVKSELEALAEKELSEAKSVEVHVAVGHVAETILRIAESLSADLIVMASHPPNELRTLLVGSQADKVVRHSPIPVLVAR